MGEKAEAKILDEKPEDNKKIGEFETIKQSDPNVDISVSWDEHEDNEEEENNEEYDDEEDEDEDEDEEDDDEEEEEEEEEREEEEKNVKEVSKRRCQRKKKIKSVCLDYDEEEQEEDEEEENENEKSCESYEFSTGSSILSALTFQWNDKSYEFEELCDPGTIENIYNKYSVVQRVADDGGKNRYTHFCRILFVAPIIRLLSAFSTSEIDLSYRGIDSKNMRAMCATLRTNAYVTKLILKYNKLSESDCYYLGYTLGVNEKISYLDLTGCRIGPIGAKLLSENLSINDCLAELNLSKCNIQDEGMKYLSRSLLRNNSIQKLDLSYNNLKTEAADYLATALKINEAIEDLNLCYNYFFDPVAIRAIFRSMWTNKALKILNISWNALSGTDVGTTISNFLRRNKNIENLDLSNNRLDGAAIADIKKGLSRSKSLVTLKLGRNPIPSDSLDLLLSGVRQCSTLLTLDLEDLWVNKSFMKLINKIKSERNLQLIIGGVYENYQIPTQDFPAILFKRANFEAMKPKSKKLRKDFGHFIWSLEDEMLTSENFMLKFKKFKAKVSKELILQIIQEFTNPKLKLVDVVAMKQKYFSLFPDSTPPPVKVKKKKKLKKLKDKDLVPGEFSFENILEDGNSEIDVSEYELSVEEDEDLISESDTRELIFESEEEEEDEEEEKEEEEEEDEEEEEEEEHKVLEGITE